MKDLQHEIASDVDSDINYPKNCIDIIEILAKFESLEPVDKQCYSRGSQKDCYIVPFRHIGIIYNVFRNCMKIHSSSTECYILP